MTHHDSHSIAPLPSCAGAILAMPVAQTLEVAFENTVRVDYLVDSAIDVILNEAGAKLEQILEQWTSLRQQLGVDQGKAWSLAAKME